MRWLKSLVVVLAGLIACALALLGYGFYKKSVDPEWRLFGATPPPAAEAPKTAAPSPAPAPTPTKPAAAPAQPWGEINLGRAAGCKVTGVDGAGDRLYLTIGPDGPCHRVVVVDVARGRVLGSVRTGP